MTKTESISATNPDAVPRRPQWWRELVIAVIALAVGLFVLPAIIYGVGVSLLGAYGGGPHMGSFYGDYFRNLGSGTFRTWFLVAAPYLLVSVLRLLFRSWKSPAAPPPIVVPEPSIMPKIVPAPTPTKTGRRDPFVSP